MPKDSNKCATCGRFMNHRHRCPTLTPAITPNRTRPHTPDRASQSDTKARVARAAEALTTKPTITREPEYKQPGLSSTGKTVWYHGTSETALKHLNGAHVKPERTFQNANVSMGGLYVTTDLALARVYARQAAQANGEPGHGVILTVEADETHLQPDEDWVVNAIENCEVDGDGLATDQRLQNIFHATMNQNSYLYTNSMSEGYKADFDNINEEWGITWKDSLEWTGNAQIASHVIHPDMILRVDPVSTHI